MNDRSVLFIGGDSDGLRRWCDVDMGYITMPTNIEPQTEIISLPSEISGSSIIAEDQYKIVPLVGGCMGGQYYYVAIKDFDHFSDPIGLLIEGYRGVSS